MAAAPPWRFDLADTTRAVLAHGLGAAPAVVSAPLLAPDERAWAALRQQTTHHRLDGLLVAAVADGTLPTSAAQRAEAAQLEVDLTRNRMWHEQRTADIVGLLEEGGVEVRVLKGPALGALDYPDAQMRPTRDLDLLVRGEQIDAAVAVLAQQGGVQTDFAVDRSPGFAATVGKGATVLLPGGLEVDLHRLLSWGPLGVRVPPEDLWRTSRPFDRGERRFETLGVEETLLHACAHLLLGGWRRALTLRDVAQVLDNPTLHPDRVIVLSRRWGAEAVLATAVLLVQRELGLAEDTFGDRAPVLSWARGLVPRWRDRLWLRIQRPDAPVPYLGRAATFSELRTPAERRMLLVATARTAADSYRSTNRPLGRELRRVTTTLARRDRSLTN